MTGVNYIDIAEIDGDTLRAERPCEDTNDHMHRHERHLIGPAFIEEAREYFPC